MWAITGSGMIRFKLKELIAEKEFQERRRITISEIVQSTGIARNTISRILNEPGWNARTRQLDKLCAYFDCRIEDLVEYVPDNPEDPSPS